MLAPARLTPTWPAALVLVSLAVSGCANHVRYVESTSDRRSSEVVEQQYAVRGPAATVAEPSLRLELEKRETLAWRTERTRTRTEEYTPYQGVREVYEVPGGLVSLPLSFVFNVTDVLLFGYIPNEVVNAYTFWTFAALNPALNAENALRVEKGEVASETEQIEGEKQVQTSPLKRFAVAVSLDAGEPQTLISDAEGRLDLDLLQLLPATLGWPPRRVSLEGRDPKTGQSVIAQSYFLDRQLSERLLRAAPLLALHGSPDAGVPELARAVYGLDQLGFRKEAAQIQDAIYARWQTSPELLTAFRTTLDRHYALGAPFDAEGAVPAAVPTP
jgi:hypothetical protein